MLMCVRVPRVAQRCGLHCFALGVQHVVLGLPVPHKPHRLTVATHLPNAQADRSGLLASLRPYHRPLRPATREGLRLPIRPPPSIGSDRDTSTGPGPTTTVYNVRYTLTTTTTTTSSSSSSSSSSLKAPKARSFLP